VTGEHGRAAIGGGYVFWVGGAERYVDGEPESIDVLRFDLDTGLTQKIYTAPDGWSPSRLLQFRGGRLFIDMVDSPGNNERATRLVSMDSDGRNQLRLAETPVLPAPAQDCFPYLNVAGISATGEAVVNVFSAVEFPGSGCAAIKASMTVSAIAADGTSSQLLADTSPWMAGTRDDVGLGFIFKTGVWGASRNWLLQYSPNGRGILARDRTTGATYRTAMEGAPEQFQAWSDGSAFAYLDTDCRSCGAYVIPSMTQRKSVPLDRKNIVSEFRACGDQILELYRPFKVKGKSKASRLVLRGHNGNVARRLSQKLATYSELVDCDGDTALLRRNPEENYTAVPLQSSKKRAQPELLYTVALG
jgi:hypothetical protein